MRILITRSERSTDPRETRSFYACNGSRGGRAASDIRKGANDMNIGSKKQVLSNNVSALIGGSGSAVVLLPGWPHTAEAYDEIFPFLARRHQVFAIAPPGLGDSGPSTAGY